MLVYNGYVKPLTAYCSIGLVVEEGGAGEDPVSDQRYINIHQNTRSLSACTRLDVFVVQTFLSDIM